jgi:hypothetical protein
VSEFHLNHFCVTSVISNDLKSQFRGAYYALETIKIVEPKAEENLIEKVKAVISRIGSIHRYPVSVSSA